MRSLHCLSGGTPSPFPAEPEQYLIGQAGEYACPSLILDDVKSHPAFQTVCYQLYASDEESVQYLGQLAGRQVDYQVGAVQLDVDSLPEVAKLMADTPTNCVAKGWNLLHTLIEGVGAELAYGVLKTGLRRELSGSQIVEVLSYLASVDFTETVDCVFREYLKNLVTKPEPVSLIKKLKLRAQNGTWQDCTKLCVHAQGIGEESLLSEKHWKVVKPVLSALQNSSSVDSQHAEAKPAEEILPQCFGSWGGRGLEPLIGGFVALLGGGQVRHYAQQMLSPHGTEWFYQQIPWTQLPMGVELGGGPLESAVGRHDYRIRLVSADSITVGSILGDPIKVTLKKSFTTLLVGHPKIQVVTGQAGNRFRVTLLLRSLDPSVIDEQRLSNMLRKSSEKILDSVYGQTQPNLSGVWTQLRDTNQFDVTVATRLILDHLFFYLGQFKVANSPALSKYLHYIDDCRRSLAEFSGTEKEGQFREKHEAAVRDLGTMLGHDPQVQSAVLAAVRGRLLDSQYDSSSVPFELFQNADDAVQELHEVVGDKPEESVRRRFVISEEQAGSVIFLHWGRMINWTGSGDFDGRRLGYHRDLEKMLVLSASDKQLPKVEGEPLRLTGRFGLGFKSVLLTCDRPIVVSGQLQIEVVGGVLPNPLKPEDAAVYLDILQQHGSSTRQRGTLIAITSTDTNHDQMLERFLRLSGYLAALGRAIDELAYVDKEGNRSETRWNGQAVAGIKAIETCSLRPVTGDGRVTALRVTTESGTLLFGIGESGIEALPNDVPCIWVTAPTREDARLGFLINASFDIDPGRARLSGSHERNLEVAKELGSQFQNILEHLYSFVTKNAKNWHQVQSELYMSHDRTDYDLWGSLWTVCSKALSESRNSPAGRLASAVLQNSLGCNEWRRLDGTVRSLERAQDLFPKDAEELEEARKRQKELENWLGGQEFLKKLNDQFKPYLSLV
jgi:hypothetical protein